MLKFIDDTPPGECVFCKLIAGQLPSARVHDDDLTVAFMDIGQVNPGHVLVASRRHATTLLDLTPQDAGAAMQSARRIALAVQAAIDPPGMTLLQAYGREGEQTVFHFHLHVVPRHAVDGMTLGWPRRRPSAESLQADAARIRAALENG